MPYKNRSIAKKYQREYYQKRKEEGTLKRYPTSPASKKKYNDKTYTIKRIMLRKKEDAELLEFLESEKEAGRSPTIVLKNFYELYKSQISDNEQNH